MPRFSAVVLSFTLAMPSALAMRMAATSALKLNEKPGLCDEAIVKDTCILLNGENDGDEGKLTSAEALRAVLSANKDTLLSFLSELGISTEQLECQDLCSKIVDAIPQFGALPPSSDVACIANGDEIECDVDVSPEAIRNASLGADEDLPDFHDKKFLEKKAAFMLAQLNLNGTADAPSALLQASVPEGIDYGHWELIERMANLFRIYPTEKPKIKMARGGVSVMASHQEWTYSQGLDNERKEKLAIAYMGTTIRQLQAKNTATHFKTWFGSQAVYDYRTRKEVLRVLNSVNHMIANVEYVYPGPQCSPNTYAYVYPTAYTCRSSSQLKSQACTKYNGKFVFYLCPFYFTRPNEMVETLVHEGSHHATSYTDDVDFNGGTAYGRYTCKNLARSNPTLALKNADNFCYYIEDVGRSR